MPASLSPEKWNDRIIKTTCGLCCREMKFILLYRRMIPVLPHGEFTPTEFTPTIKFLFRVRPQLLVLVFTQLSSSYWMFSKNHFSLCMFDKLRWLFACSRAHCNKVQRLLVISPRRSLAINELSTKGSHLATKQSFLATSNLMRQWIKERRVISICNSIWLGANSIELSRCEGELAMGRNRQLPYWTPLPLS